MAVLVVPVSCVSQGGLEQTVRPTAGCLGLCTVPVWAEPMLERAVAGVMVVPVRRFSGPWLPVAVPGKGELVA